MKTVLLYLAAIGAVLWLLVIDLGRVPLTAPDELREGEIAREMFVTGEAWIPQLNGEPFLEKPPLFYWLVAAGYRMMGVTPLAGRLPSVLAAVGTALVLAAMLERLFGFRTAVSGFLVLLSCYGFLSQARDCMLDMTLAFWVALGVLLLSHPVRSISQGLAYGLAGGIAACAAFYAKGPIGPVTVYLAAGSYFLWQEREHKKAWIALFAASIVPLAAGAAWWTWILRQKGGDAFVHTYWWYNQVDRFSGSAREHHKPFWYYLETMWDVLLPWCLAIPPLAWLAVKEKRWRTPQVALLLCWFTAPFLFLSVSHTKRSLYLLPILAPAAGLLAFGFSQWRSDDPAQRWATAWMKTFIYTALAAAALVAGGVLFGLPPAFHGRMGGFHPPYALAPSNAALAAALLAAIGLLFWAARHALNAHKTQAVLPIGVLTLSLILGLLLLGPLWERNEGKTFGAFFDHSFPLLSRPDERKGYNLSEFNRAAVPYHLSRIQLNHTLPMLKDRPELEAWILDPAKAGKDRILFVEETEWNTLQSDPRLAPHLWRVRSIQIRREPLVLVLVK